MRMEPGHYLETAVDTRGVAPARRKEFWRRHVTDNHGDLVFTFATAPAFAGGTRVQRADGLQLVDFWSSAIAYERTPGGFAVDGDDSLRILVPLSGAQRVGAPGGELRPVPVGAAALLSMEHGFRLEHDGPARGLIATVPTYAWPPVRCSVLPWVWSLQRGITAAGATLLREISVRRSSFAAGDFARALGAALGLLRDGEQPEQADLVAGARAVVRQHFADPEFGPAQLADTLGWSLRTVQVALHAAGTSPARMVREERLRASAARLRDPAWTGETVSAIAHACGFASLSAFNAGFRQVHGCTPAQYRLGGAGPDGTGSVGRQHSETR